MSAVHTDQATPHARSSRRSHLHLQDHGRHRWTCVTLEKLRAYPALSSEWHDKLFRLQQSREIDIMPVLTLAKQHWKRPDSAQDGLSPTKVPAHAGGGKKASSAANMALNTFLDLHPISGALLLQHARVNMHCDLCSPSNQLSTVFGMFSFARTNFAGLHAIACPQTEVCARAAHCRCQAPSRTQQRLPQ